MEALTWDVLTFLDASNSLSKEQFEQLVRFVRTGARNAEQVRNKLVSSVSKKTSNLSSDPVMALKVAQGYYALGEYRQSLDWLEKSGGSQLTCQLKAQCLKVLGRFSEAIAQLEQAESKGMDSFDAAMAVVDCLRRSGELDAAQERLKRVSRVGEIRAEYHFQLGRLIDVTGMHGEAIDEYHKAIELDGRHTEALFHLAYACDLYGDEDDAMEYYEQCIESGPVHVSALLNLALLYEEAGQYSDAARCAKRVLAVYPNHARARMFLKDIEASVTMYIDEDRERLMDRRNQVLEIPITDFELSVRSRNCLKKMNIRVLGDLLRITETDLLAYKNFGETSLQEIKIILNQKNLRLGQLLEERGNSLGKSSQKIDEDPEVDEEYQMPIGELDLSVRSRKCLQRLNINTVGDLISRTEAELLGCKNFGMTSLLELKQRLTERHFSLRQLDD